MSERGSVTLLVTALAGLLTVAIIGVGAVGEAYSARVRAATAADAAALAAAVATYPGTGRDLPPREADRAARANGAVLVECLCPVDRTLRVRTVTVRTAVTVDLLVFGRLTVRGAARAEFDPAAWWGP